MADLPQRVEIGASRSKLFLLTIAGILMTTVSGLIAFRVFEDVQPGSFHHFIGWIGLVFFGFCTLVALWRLLTARGVILTLDAQGLRDTRISEMLIPWGEVRDITTWQTRSVRIMILAVDPEFAKSLNPSHFAGAMRGASSCGRRRRCLDQLQRFEDQPRRADADGAGVLEAEARLGGIQRHFRRRCRPCPSPRPSRPSCRRHGAPSSRRGRGS